MNKVELILFNVCKYFGITIEQIKSKSRRRPVVYPRQIAIYLIRTNTKLTTVSIGREFGRDHTTVIHSVQSINNLSAAYEKTRNHLQDILKLAMIGDPIGNVSPYVFPGLKYFDK